MIDGKYEVSMDLPVGPIKGILYLVTDEMSVNGYLEAMGKQSPFSGGTVEGNQFRFTGNFKTILGNINYNITGTVNGNKLEIEAVTNKGNFKIEGNKI